MAGALVYERLEEVVRQRRQEEQDRGDEDNQDARCGYEAEHDAFPRQAHGPDGEQPINCSRVEERVDQQD